MIQMLLDIRKDACGKIKSAGKAEMGILLEAEVNLLKLAAVMRDTGRSGLGKAVLPVNSDYLEMLVLYAEGATEKGMLKELGANEYWIRDPQGIQAMVHYFYLRGMLCIIENIHPLVLKKLFGTLIPEEWREDYDRQLEEAEVHVLGWHALTNKELTGKCLSICPEFASTELLEKIEKLEDIIERMSDRSLDRALREKGNSYEWAQCIYGLGRETRKRVLANVSEEFGYRIMDDMICYSRRDDNKEETVLSAVEKVYNMIRSLAGDGEIIIDAKRRNE